MHEIHWLGQHGIHTPAINLVSLLLLWVVLGFNLWCTRRTQHFLKELLATRRKVLHDYIEALSETSAAVCPLCAIAAGDGAAKATYTDGDQGMFEVDEELEGWHQVRSSTHGKRMSCNAIPLRKACRAAFKDLMEATTAGSPHTFGILHR